ncbi:MULTISPECIES: hypothetical protein [Bacteria]|uniref:hypothetical protein n=1 Tax=Bacteria TaxID=2 RepID=UPI000B21D974|nr:MULTISPECIES: hypothetical protein [Bacteria]MED3865405.1 hypothetical protein [Priestia megaterium]MED4219195.1 hypothetical protein [Priestia megaterium]
MRKKPTLKELYIANLKELKTKYDAAGDVFSSRKTTELIDKYERGKGHEKGK